MIDRFSNGDKENDNPIKHDSLFTPANYQGGDLQGIINKMEINTKDLSPGIYNVVIKTNGNTDTYKIIK